MVLFLGMPLKTSCLIYILPGVCLCISTYTTKSWIAPQGLFINFKFDYEVNLVFSRPSIKLSLLMAQTSFNILKLLYFFNGHCNHIYACICVGTLCECAWRASLILLVGIFSNNAHLL